MPGYYANRPLHVHYIIAPPEGDSLTTQLYFEFDPRAAGESSDLVIPLDTVDGHFEGTFDINLNYDVPAAADPHHSAPTASKLHQSYPNPFRPAEGRATIRYQLRLESKIVLEVFTPTGTRIRRLVQEKQGPGFYTAEWDGRDESGRDAPAGLYLYRLRAGNTTEVQKMTLMR